MTAIREIVRDQIWVKEWPVHFAGMDILTRMTVLRMADGVFLHSPVEIDAATRAAIEALGTVRAIIAPSTVHHLFVASAQAAFPSALTYGIEGLETKRDDLRFDGLIGAEPPPLWAGQLDQITIGNRVMREVDFLHRASRTLILTDLVENFQDETPGTNVFLREFMEVAGMWGHPRPAPELRLFTLHQRAARDALEKLLAWDFDRAIVSHGELLEQDPKAAIREAWSWILA
ncbi:MAG: hypothetical protein ABI467_18645 [Kofleriaceae bacterium]